jgi:hypothetical protein
MTQSEQDDPSNIRDMLIGATIIVCCAAVVILALVIGLIVWLLVG